MRARTLLGLLLVGLIALGAAAFAAVSGSHIAGSDPITAPPSPFDGAVIPPGKRAADFSLRDQDGRPIAMHDFRGRPVVVTFLYTHCRDTCPAEAQQIKGAFDDLGHDLPAIAISVDPRHDSAESVKRFLAEQGMRGRVRFALGSSARLAPLWRSYGVTPQTDRAEHMALTLLIDRRGFERIGYPGSQMTPERLAHDLTLLERE